MARDLGCRRFDTIVLAVVTAGACLVTLAAGGESHAPDTAPTPSLSTDPPMHADAVALERAILDGFRSYLRGDAAALRSALDVVEKGCRRVSRAEPSSVPKDLLTWDTAFHRALSVARESAARGDLEQAYDQLRWLPKGCRGCHDSRTTSSESGPVVR